MKQEQVLALGHVVIDDVRLADGTTLAPALGGAGAYAALGQSLVTRAVTVLSGVGEDFPTEIRRNLARAGIDPRGLIALDPRTPRTRIQYFDDGEREETPAFGTEHFQKLDPALSMLPADVRASAMYVFDEINPELFGQLLELREETRAPILWEIHAAICDTAHEEAVREQAASVDAISLNRAEAIALFATDDLNECLYRLADLAPTVLLRLGASGAAVIENGTILRAVPPGGEVVDPTGAGNASSGAFAASWAVDGHRSDIALRKAMAASALTIRQIGPPPVDDELREDLERIATTIDVTTTPLENGISL